MSGITDPTEAYFKDGAWGWDGTQWRKLPLVWGYSDRWAETTDGTASGAGDAVCTTTAVATGYVYVLQAATFYHNAGVNKALELYLRGGSDYTWLVEELTATTGRRYMWAGSIMLKAGDWVYAKVGAPGDGKKIYLRVWGYKMKIAE